MKLSKHAVIQLKNLYRTKKKEILYRLKQFGKIRSDGSDEEIFTELAFCILTPQSKAKYCWDAIVKLGDKKVLFRGDTEKIKEGLRYVRFKNKKAVYIVKARESFLSSSHSSEHPPFPPLPKGGVGGLNNGGWKGFSIKSILSKFNDVNKLREWLVDNIKGIGYKEASHFLRNIGFGEKIAILDRHILRNLFELGLIKEIPQSISRERYMQIEKIMAEFAREVDIPISHLDLLLWYKETGEIFK